MREAAKASGAKTTPAGEFVKHAFEFRTCLHAGEFQFALLGVRRVARGICRRPPLRPIRELRRLRNDGLVHVSLLRFGEWQHTP